MNRRDENCCSEPRCRAPVHLNYIGSPLCERHWTERCAEAATAGNAERVAADTTTAGGTAVNGAPARAADTPTPAAVFDVTAGDGAADADTLVGEAISVIAADVAVDKVDGNVAVPTGDVGDVLGHVKTLANEFERAQDDLAMRGWKLGCAIRDALAGGTVTQKALADAIGKSDSWLSRLKNATQEAPADGPFSRYAAEAFLARFHGNARRASAPGAGARTAIEAGLCGEPVTTSASAPARRELERRISSTIEWATAVAHLTPADVREVFDASLANFVNETNAVPTAARGAAASARRRKAC